MYISEKQYMKCILSAVFCRFACLLERCFAADRVDIRADLNLKDMFVFYTFRRNAIILLHTLTHFDIWNILFNFTLTLSSVPSGPMVTLIALTRSYS